MLSLEHDTIFSIFFVFRIGFSIAKKLKEEGASVMVSSRKEDNVKSAVEKLRQEEGGQVEGMVCHVGKAEHRVNLVKEVVMCRDVAMLVFP